MRSAGTVIGRGFRRELHRMRWLFVATAAAAADAAGGERHVLQHSLSGRPRGSRRRAALQQCPAGSRGAANILGDAIHLHHQVGCLLPFSFLEPNLPFTLSLCLAGLLKLIAARSSKTGRWRSSGRASYRRCQRTPPPDSDDLPRFYILQCISFHKVPFIT